MTTTEGSWSGTKVGTHARRQRRHQHLQLGRQRAAERDVLGVHHRAQRQQRRRLGAIPPGRYASSGRCRSTPSCFVPLNPARLLDTRDGTGGNISALSQPGADRARGSPVSAGCPRPARPLSCSTSPSTPRLTSGFITAWPSGEGQPTVSNLNYVAGQTVPNLVTVKVGANGRVNLYNSEGYTHLIADVVGYYTARRRRPVVPGGSRPSLPDGVLDTRQRRGGDDRSAPGRRSIVTVTGGSTAVPAGRQRCRPQRHRRSADRRRATSPCGRPARRSRWPRATTSCRA